MQLNIVAKPLMFLRAYLKIY